MTITLFLTGIALAALYAVSPNLGRNVAVPLRGPAYVSESIDQRVSKPVGLIPSILAPPSLLDLLCRYAPRRLMDTHTAFALAVEDTRALLSLTVGCNLYALATLWLPPYPPRRGKTSPRR